VSHSKEREEKICLNCSAELYGRYCHSCGQQNIEPKQSVWHLVTHFFYDITHFDGKFFDTLKYLIRRPGFLPREYINGRRAAYLDPIRMYVFTSALFFIFFYSLFDIDLRGKGMSMSASKAERDSVDKKMNSARLKALRAATSKEDSAEIERAFTMMKGFAGRIDDKDLKEAVKGEKAKWGIRYVEYKTRAAYDSAQKTLNPELRDSWLERQVVYKNIALADKYGTKTEADFWKDVIDKFLHTFPYLLFISLPLYALFLKLLYIRRKQYYYVDHGIFLIHLYIFTFLVLLVFFGLQKLDESLNINFWIGLLEVILFFYGVIYTILAMKRFYQQGTGKTLLKFILLNILATIAISFLFTFFFLFTLMRL
jgi:hypothetical protein